MRHDPSVVHHASFCIHKEMTIISTSVHRVAVHIGRCLVGKRFGVTLTTPSVLHAQRVWIFCTARPMNQAACHSLIGICMCKWIRDFSRHDRIDIFGCSEFGSVIQSEEDVSMWETPFLELNHPDFANDNSKNLPVREVTHELLEFDVKYPSDQIRSILRCLSCFQLSGDLRPLGVARECDK